MFLTCIVHRPDADDGTYLNLAVSVVDDASLPILTFDRKHRLDHEVRIRTASRLRSFEMLSAAYARTTGRPAIEAAHLILPPIGAFLCLVAYRFLLQLLLPRTWATALGLVVLFLLFDGGSHRTFGNFSFVRLHQGKGWLLSILVPAVLAYAWCFARQPTRRRWLRLLAAQIAAVGVSSTALLVMPLVLLQGVAGALLVGAVGRRIEDWRTALRTALLAVSTGAYVALCALVARLPVVKALAGPDAELLTSRQGAEAGWLDPVLGDDPVAQAFRLALLLTAPFWAPRGAARWFCAVASALAAGLLLGTWIPDALARYWVPPGLLWRLVWALPLPLVAAVLVLWPYHRWTLPRRIQISASVVLAASLIVGPWSAPSILAPDGEVHVGRPGLKVGAGYEAARQVVEILGPGPVVAAPTEVSMWLPTFHHHPFPMLSRAFDASRTRFRGETEDRLKMQQWMDRPPAADGFPERKFLDRLRRFHVDAMVLGADPPYDPMRDILRRSGWQARPLADGRQLWTTEALGQGARR